MELFLSLADFARPYWLAAQGFVLPAMMVGLVFIGPALCKASARLHCSRRPWYIKSSGLLAAGGAMLAGNWVFYQCVGRTFTWYVWLPDLLFVVAMLGWLRTPMRHLRAGSADRLDDKIEKFRPDGWNALICRWIPSTGYHRVLLTKAVDGAITTGRALRRAA